MTMFWVLLLIVGLGHPQVSTRLPVGIYFAQAAQNKPPTETTESNRVETEAELWMEPEKKPKGTTKPNTPTRSRPTQQISDKASNDSPIHESPVNRRKRALNQAPADLENDPARKKTATAKETKISQDLPVQPEKPIHNPNNLLTPSGTTRDLEGYWKQRQKHLAQSDHQLAKQNLTQFIELKNELGIRNAFLEANVLILEAERAIQSQDRQTAQQRIQAAIELAPDLSGAYIAQASLWFSENHFGLGRVFQQLGESVAASLRDPLSYNRLIVNALIAVILGLGLSCIVVVITQLIRISGIYFHDFHHLFPKGATPIQTNILAVVLIFLPILFRMGLVVSLFFWISIIWLYQSGRERLVTVFILIYLSMAPLALQTIVTGLLLPGSRVPHFLDVMQGTASASSLKAMDLWLEEKPNDPTTMTVMASYYKRTGQLTKARKYLEDALRLQPDSPEIANNLGNILFLSNEVDQAIRMYDQAAKLQPNWTIPYFNLSRAFYKKMDLNRGKQYHSHAYGLDPDLVRSLSDKAKTRKINDVVADLPMPSSWLFFSHILEAESTNISQSTVHLWKAWGGVGKPEHFPFIGGGIGLLLAFLALLRGRIQLSGICIKCGRPVCRRCNSELYDDLVCGQCFHAFIQKDRVDAKSKISKEIQIRQYLRRRENIARSINFVIPGVGQLIKERPMRGALFVTVFCLAIVQVVLAPGVIPDSRNLSASFDWMTMIPIFCLLLTFYAWAIMNIFRVDS